MTSRESLNSFLYTLFGFKKAQSRSDILLIVIIHVMAWGILFLLPMLLYTVRINDRRFIVAEMIDKSVWVGLFYLNYYLLIPKLFQRRKYWLYLSAVLLAFFIYLAQYMAVRYDYIPRPGSRFQLLTTPFPHREDSLHRRALGFGEAGRFVHGQWRDSNHHRFSRPFLSRDSLHREFPPFHMHEPGLFGIPKGIWEITLDNTLTSFALLLLIGGFIRLTYSFIRNQNEKKALENLNLNAEVNFLKSQINPHFLFNTLNSIYAQAHSRSDKTEFSILKLSELLRYVLYDSGERKVDLAKDIQYLNNYIDLQKIRLSSKVTVKYDVSGNLHGHMIAPLLLISFIENAFKHGVSYSQASVINITIRVFEKTLTLVVDNPIVERNSFDTGGLGLKNVTRRLELLYPGKYQLDIRKDELQYSVNLKLKLESD